MDEPLPALQQRSQETTEHLLEAAEELLRQGGADAATLRAIAERAGVSLGIVYRRFPDKDAILRAVYTRFFERFGATNTRSLSSDRFQRASLAEVAHTLVTGIAEGYRRHARLVRALLLYARSHPSSEFRERAAAHNARTLTVLQGIFDRHRPEITHPRPEVAVPFAISSAAALLQVRIVFNDTAAEPALPFAELVAEATRLVVSYLTAVREE
jgi:AcrR family transcriptional regulator